MRPNNNAVKPSGQRALSIQLHSSTTEMRHRIARVEEDTGMAGIDRWTWARHSNDIPRARHPGETFHLFHYFLWTTWSHDTLKQCLRLVWQGINGVFGTSDIGTTSRGHSCDGTRLLHRCDKFSFGERERGLEQEYIRHSAVGAMKAPGHCMFDFSCSWSSMRARDAN